MRLLITATSLRSAYGGPAFSVSQLASALASRGVSTGIWAADGSAAESELLPAAAQVERLDGPLADAARTFAPDVIHDNGLWLPHNHGVATLAREGGVPRLVSTRGMLEPWAVRHKGLKKKFAWRLYQRRDLERASALHTTAEAEAENLRSFGLAVPVITIPNGVELPELPTSPSVRDDRTRTALFLGRLYPVKGLPMLIEAWSKVRPPGWRLVIAGPDEARHRGELELAVAATKLGDVVRFAGPVEGEAKAALLREADVLVLPSHSESFGMVVAEALAHGTPVLTTTAVPWPQLEQRGCGWRCAPTTDAIAEALRAITAREAATLRSMGAAGRDLVAETLGWDGIAAQFAALYRRLAENPAMVPAEVAA
ncbi:MAG TPA: glycosyltransferase [Caulobacteraceae bacterium]|nr:glycosyltransferase [Caulobacteraceae bacterium]